ncbi:MAG: four helix bundle protein, partial [Phycisphaerales bacterium]|nr:four helix bundle protein [Phycisphaerales bacterium]
MLVWGASRIGEHDANLASQLRRSAQSVAQNTAEGMGARAGARRQAYSHTPGCHGQRSVRAVRRPSRRGVRHPTPTHADGTDAATTVPRTAKRPCRASPVAQGRQTPHR